MLDQVPIEIWALTNFGGVHWWLWIRVLARLVRLFSCCLPQWRVTIWLSSVTLLNPWWTQLRSLGANSMAVYFYVILSGEISSSQPSLSLSHFKQYGVLTADLCHIGERGKLRCVLWRLYGIQFFLPNQSILPVFNSNFLNIIRSVALAGHFVLIISVHYLTLSGSCLLHHNDSVLGRETQYCSDTQTLF